MIEDLRQRGHWALSALLCLALVIWSLIPVTSHTPAVIETLQEHAQTIADHGHSHGFEEDLAWALHGHSHDSADHDHGQAVITRAEMPSARLQISMLSAVEPGIPAKAPVFPRKRPPRV